ncbi:MAG: SAM-dependent chlorinase/fluorinase [Deltaproteobacteria bacterium]|nr:SAM-dependent chlorinase/fluorinase [Deltaproteobacteria bacterium]
MNQTPLITLTTDFGWGPFVGVMKGVILGLCPGAGLVDLAHDLPPQDVRAGAQVLAQALGVFPPDTVHLAVVDPGVGTGRRALVAQGAGCLWVGPDNGLLTPVWEADPATRAWEITRSELFRHPVSATFHGRDVFAPVAARLAGGLDPAEVGLEMDDPVLLPRAQPRREPEGIVGQIVARDHFGNLASNLPQTMVTGYLAGRPGEALLWPGEGAPLVFPLKATYGHSEPGGLLAVFDSLGRLELAENQGHLARRLGLEPGSPPGWRVLLRPRGAGRR